MERRTILDIARHAHSIHKQHHQLEVAVAQESDELGVSLQIDLQAAIPQGALLLGRISGLWPSFRTRHCSGDPTSVITSGRRDAFRAA